MLFINLKSLTVVTLLILLPVTAIAAGGGGAHHAPDISHLTWYWFNFLVYCGILYILLKKPVTGFWHQRWQAIESKINKGEKALLAAEEELRIARENMANLEDSIAALKKQVAEETRHEEEALLQDSKVQVERIEKQLAMTIDSEQQVSQRELQDDLARKVLAKTEKELRQYFDSGKDKEYRGAALDSLAAIAETVK